MNNEQTTVHKHKMNKPIYVKLLTSLILEVKVVTLG